MIVVTGATGQLGRLVVEQLLRTVDAARVVAVVRDPAKAADLQSQGVQLRKADYSHPESLDAAFDGAETLLLISSNAIGQRIAQHRAVIESAARNRVGLIAYTSLLHCDTSPLGLATEHRATEDLLAASGLPFALLRNGWYTENLTASVPAALAHGVVIGSAGEGRISSASRLDYATAAAAVLTQPGQGGRVYELAGDTGYTLAELAAEIARQSGRAVRYDNLSQAAHQQALLGFGLPAPIATMLADSDTHAAGGALFDDSHQLSRLIGRPTTPLAATVQAALASAG